MITGFIYKIYNLKDTSQFYVGSTVNYSRRKSHHKKNVTNKVGKRYWTKLYVYIRDNGGWINFGMEQIVKQEFNSLNELHAFEQTFIDNLKPPLNSIKSCIHSQPKIEEPEPDVVDDHWVMTSYKPLQIIEEQPNTSSDDKSPLLFIIDLN